MKGRAALAAALSLLLLMAACGQPPGPPASRTAPAPPSDLRATAGDESVTLDWVGSSSTGVAQYNVYQGTAEDDLEKVGEVGASERAFHASGLTNGTEYFFALDAEDDSGNKSTQTAIVRATPEARVPPQVVLTVPEDGDADVFINTNINVVFSKQMDRDATEAAMEFSPAVDCDFSWGAGDMRLTCTPQSDLDPGQSYTVTVGTGASDSDGIKLESDIVFQFTSGTTAATVCTFGTSKFGACVFGR